ncbi:hypothetical protein ACGFZL_05435 [Streptomyces sp. NPDC048182]|uniref:hypothetical protein n=1 Tax=Streptomyces sp. NPDC048182 TaxID=3365507 RepID=UPI0037177DA3
MITSEGARLGGEAACRLARTGRYEFKPGLSDAEFARIEHEYGFEFADDHRAFLAAGLPVNVPPEEGQTWATPWPDWRNGDPQKLRGQLAWPTEGVLWDVEHSGYWHESWGERPTAPETALTTARLHLANAPTLVPVYAHRFLPAGRGTHGHPVLSVWQTDLIYYGLDLVDYMHREFDEPRDEPDETWNPQATVPFWSCFL